MTRLEFIARLSSALSTSQSADTVNGLIADFNEHFDEAMRAGKGEEEICDMLGNPEEIAAEYGEGAVRHDIPADDELVYISLYHVNVSCEPSGDDEFHVEVRQNSRVVNDDTIRIEQTDRSLRITQQREKGFMGLLFRAFVFSETVFVRIPRRFSGNMTVHMTSGNARFNGFSVRDDFRCELTSGNMNLSQVSSGGLMTVCSRSGNITVDNCAGDLSAECHSGNVKVNYHKGNVLRAATTSGTVRVSADHITKDCTIAAKSGSLHLDLNKLDSSLFLDCYSGSIKFSIRELCGNITGKTRSGSITGALSHDTRAVFMLQSSITRNMFPNAVMPEPGVPVVNLATHSGLIRLNEL